MGDPQISPGVTLGVSILSHGGFHSHGGTPSSHPLIRHHQGGGSGAPIQNSGEATGDLLKQPAETQLYNIYIYYMSTSKL